MPPNSRAFGHRSSSFLETEAQSGRGIDVVALEKAVGQSAIHLREHCPDINVPLCRKAPIGRDRDCVKSPGALRMLAAGAGSGAIGRAEVRILDVMVIGPDHIQFVRNAVFHTGPHHLKNLVTRAVHPKGRIVDGRIVERVAALANEVSGDARKGGLRIAGRGISNAFVAGVQLKRSCGVFGHNHNGSIVGDRRCERLRQERGYRHSICVIASRRK
jgi:hypothetical protein